MSDSKTRELERRVAQDPTDHAAAAALERERSKAGTSRLSMLRRYVGRWVYVEGARLNYGGVLKAVTGNASGDPCELLFDPLWRIGTWGALPNMDSCQLMPSELGMPQWLPWCAVDNFGLMVPRWIGEFNATAP